MLWILYCPFDRRHRALTFPPKYAPQPLPVYSITLTHPPTQYHQSSCKFSDAICHDNWLHILLIVVRACSWTSEWKTDHPTKTAGGGGEGLGRSEIGATIATRGGVWRHIAHLRLQSQFIGLEDGNLWLQGGRFFCCYCLAVFFWREKFVGLGDFFRTDLLLFSTLTDIN